MRCDSDACDLYFGCSPGPVPAVVVSWCFLSWGILELQLLLARDCLFRCSFVVFFVYALLAYSCIAFSANVVSAFATADVVAASAASGGAHAANAASLARFAKICKMAAFIAFYVVFACLSCSSLLASASAATKRRSASFFALRSWCYFSSSSVLGRTLCPARCSVSSFA